MAKSNVIAATRGITLRKRKLRSGKGYTLTIDTSVGDNRSEEYLGLHLTGNKDTDNQTLELAKKIYAKRVLEIQAEAHGEIDRSKMSADFIFLSKRLKLQHNYRFVVLFYYNGNSINFAIVYFY